MARLRLGVLASVPEPFASQIDGIRGALGMVGVGRIHPHVTVVPPFNLHKQALGALEYAISESLVGFGSFDVEVGPPDTFSAESPVLFLRVLRGGEVFSEMHRRLAVGDLRPRHERSFIPHITIADGLEPQKVADLVRLLHGYSATFRVESLDLCEKPAEPDSRWRIDSSWLLDDGPRSSAFGAGRLRLSVRAGTPMTTELWFSSQDVLDTADQSGPAQLGRSFVVEATLGAEVIGAAEVGLLGGFLQLRRIVVAVEYRSMGVGVRIIRRLGELGESVGAVAIVSERYDPFLQRIGFEPIQPSMAGLLPYEKGMMLYRLSFAS